MNVLILGVGGNVGQGIIKALRNSNLKAQIHGACISPYSAGLYMCDKQIISPYATDGLFIEWLVTYCRKYNINVVLSGVEEVLKELSCYKIFLEKETNAKIIVSNKETFDICLDKYQTIKWLEDNGLNHPKTYKLSEINTFDECVKKLGTISISKPIHGKGSIGVSKINNENDFLKLKEKKSSEMILQEYLGNDASEYTSAVYCDRAGKIRGSIIFKRTLFSGTTYKAEIVENKKGENYITELVSKLKPTGPCNIQFRMHNNKPVCFEINLRFSGTTPVRAHFGFNDVEFALRNLVLNEKQNDLPIVTKGVMLRYWNEIYPEESTLTNLITQEELS